MFSVRCISHAVWTLGLALSPLAVLGERTVVTSQDQLPRFSYPFTGQVREFVVGFDGMRQLAPRFRADLESLLRDYDIRDEATQQSVLGTLLLMDVAEGRWEQALTTIARMRELERKPAQKLTMAVRTEAYVRARQAVGDDLAGFDAEYRRIYAELMAPLPWEVVRDVVKQTKGGFELGSREVVVGALSSQWQESIDRNGEISDVVARSLVGGHVQATVFLPLKEASVAVLTEYINRHDVQKPDIWAAREVSLAGVEGLTPVVVGVWDSGVDPAVFANRLFTHPSPDLAAVPAGRHGIAFDLEQNPAAELLYPLGEEQLQIYPQMRSLLKGFRDVQANIDSPEASLVKTTYASLKADQVKEFSETLNLFGNYTHGTHVAGIALAGNPAAQLAPARVTFDHRTIPELPTVERARRTAQAWQQIVAYLREANARVVNMSWGGGARGFEIGLELHGVGKDAAERKALAREMFEIVRDGLIEAMRGAPEILFVVAAGNSNNNNAFNEQYPSGFTMPNMITVGAVDQAGEETSFSTFGENVAVHANGFEVESDLPGGYRLPFSGTSMAAPQVANLAAKLLALDPTLRPDQLVALIKASADRSEDGRIRNIHPKRAVAMLEARRAH